MEKISDFLRVADAADYLGVSPNTLRNWENAGKINALRNPMNDHRLFRRSDLDSLLQKFSAPKKKLVK
jgi:DNA (cytosine-5)-methyltransferase 1